MIAMKSKKENRLRRARRTREKIRELGAHRLSVHRTPQHIYAQVIDPAGEKVIASASTVQKDIRDGLKSTGNAEAAAAVGKAIAEKSKSAGVDQVAFDRSGFKYHGRIKALADAAREHGLKL
jgi:large subunit ribosomal protein L18